MNHSPGPNVLLIHTAGPKLNTQRTITITTVISSLQDAPVECTLVDKQDGQSLPLLEITIDEESAGRTAFEVCRRLRSGNPAVYVGHGKLSERKLTINPMCFTSEDAARISQELNQVLSN